MFCKNCGNQIADGTAFCGVCGAQITDASAAENNQPGTEPEVAANEAAAPADTTQYEAAAPETEPVAPTYVNDGEVNDAAPKKKSSKKWLFIGIPVLAVILAVVLCFNTLTGFVLKTFGSNAAYFAYVEGTSLGEYSKTATSVYGIGKNTIANGVGMEGEIAIELGDTLTTMLSGYAGGMDLSWLNQIKLVVDSDSANGNGSCTAALILGDQTVLNLEYIIDNDKGAIYLRCKELSDKFITFDISGGNTVFLPTATNSVSNVGNNLSTIVAKYLPDEEQLEKLLEKYVTILLKQITDDDVTREAGEITANGITQKCTILKLNITDRLVLNVAKAVLNEAENDKDIIAVIEDLEKGINEVSEVSGNAVEEYKNSVAEAKTEIEDAIASLEGNGNEYFTLTDYVNGSHEILGREISVAGIKVISILSAENGSDVGYEITVSDKLSVLGKGKKSGDAISGEFSLCVEGKELLILTIDNLSSDIEARASKGTMVMKLGKDVAELIESDAYTAISMLDLSLKVEIDTSSSKGDYTIVLLSGEKTFVKLTANEKSTDPKVAEAPAEGETINSDEFDLSDLDLSKIMENLKKAGVPESLLSILQYATMMG